MNNAPAPGSVRYIVVDRESRKTLCITPSYEEACQVWQEEIGYAAEVHAVPASSRVAFVGRGTRIADPEICHLPLCGVMLPPSVTE